MLERDKLIAIWSLVLDILLVLEIHLGHFPRKWKYAMRQINAIQSWSLIELKCLKKNKSCLCCVFIQLSVEGVKY